jgi:ABC-type phosphate transport system permease subunit
MDQIRRIADECVGRAVMFGWLAIGCVMVGFSFAPVSAFRSGAVLTLLMALVLLWQAMAAPNRNPKHTEVWLYLDENSRPAEGHARLIFGTVMRTVYAGYAQTTLGIAVGFFALSVVLQLAGLQPYTPPANPVP